MKKMQLTGVTVFDDGTTLHAKLRSFVDDGDVSHELSANVVLQYSDVDVMSLTLSQIQDDARSRLKTSEWPSI
ncbi:hypothetical protein CHR62_09260 [Pusillimonas sp. NJUB218]|nr:hypothetical protein CHR62_09260 [Pusillimonas sp. NJUB218]